jgi:NTE family protein
LAADPDRPVGLVLSGGGARGAFQVGVWEVLRNDPRGLRVAPHVISGSSGGALNGALIAAGVSPADMLEFWLGLADFPPVRANDAFFDGFVRMLRRAAVREPIRSIDRRIREARIGVELLRKHNPLSPGGSLALALEFFLTARFDTLSQFLDGIVATHIFDTAPFRQRLVDILGGPYLRQSDVRLAINTVDARTGRVLRIVNAPPTKSPRSSSAHYRYEREIPVDLILASCSIPLLFNPVRYGDRDLWDGGLLVNSPMAPAVALGARRIVPVLVTLFDAPSASMLQTFGNAIERLVDAVLENAYNVDRKLLLDRNALAERLPEYELSAVELFRAIRPQSALLFNAGSYLFFERKQLFAMYQAGKEAARAWLASGPLRDQRDREE